MEGAVEDLCAGNFKVALLPVAELQAVSGFLDVPWHGIVLLQTLPAGLPSELLFVRRDLKP